jgi:hypothetical protein
MLLRSGGCPGRAARRATNGRAAAAVAAAVGQAARAEVGSWPQEGPLLHVHHGFLAQVPSGAVVPEDQEEGAKV